MQQPLFFWHTIKVGAIIALTLIVCGVPFVFQGCGSGNAPMDAETRITIDSIVTAQNAMVRKEIDSLCVVYEKNMLPHLIDSIKKVRLREIEEQLKTVPK